MLDMALHSLVRLFWAMFNYKRLSFSEYSQVYVSTLCIHESNGSLSGCLTIVFKLRKIRRWPV